MENINKDIQEAISELNENIDAFVRKNETEMNEIKMKMMREEQGNMLPFARISNENNYNKSAFSEYIRNGNEAYMKKSLQEFNDKSGGYFLPDMIVKKVNDRLKFLSPMRSIATVMTISTNTVDMVIDSKNPDAGWSGNSEQRDETDAPEIQKIKIIAHEIYAKPKASQHLLDDANVNVEEWLVSKIAEKIAALENSAFINGSGIDKPKGFLSYNMTESQQPTYDKLQCFKTGVDGKFQDDESAINLLIDMACSIKPIYVKNAKWIMSRSALACIRKLKNKDGTVLWQPAIAESTPSTLLGYPVILDDDMPDLKDGEKSASIAFGDFSCGYQIIDRQGFKILRDPYTSKPFVEFYASKRTGGAIVDFDAIKVLKFEE
ncbi:MAG: phage major capsid protein [Alphaproteobacteria bacterium]|nr:phage major capsid protein [Alphaproteobacteria bacterium]